jgi:hypothetical protein
MGTTGVAVLLLVVALLTAEWRRAEHEELLPVSANATAPAPVQVTQALGLFKTCWRSDGPPMQSEECVWSVRVSRVWALR